MVLKCPILAPVHLDVHKSIVHKTITKGCGAVITLVENSFMQEAVKGHVSFPTVQKVSCAVTGDVFGVKTVVCDECFMSASWSDETTSQNCNQA